MNQSWDELIRSSMLRYLAKREVVECHRKELAPLESAKEDAYRQLFSAIGVVQKDLTVKFTGYDFSLRWGYPFPTDHTKLRPTFYAEIKGDYEAAPQAAITELQQYGFRTIIYYRKEKRTTLCP